MKAQKFLVAKSEFFEFTEDGTIALEH